MRRPSFASQLGLGRLAYACWHRPLAALARSRREGGPINQWRDQRGREDMQAAAKTLPPLPAPGVDAAEIVFLTGEAFWYQTAFCFWSLCRVADRPLTPVFIDDGSWNERLDAESQRLFPGSRVLRRHHLEAQLDLHLPRARFPALRGQRQSYIHLRKLTDAHVGHRGWRVCLDSDMLFFRRPTRLLDWLAAPDRPIHMLDVQTAYGYPDATLASLTGQPLPEKVNVGICGLRSEAIDWPCLESICAQLLERHGTSYYLEQALSAMLLTGQPTLALPAGDYRVLPDSEECLQPSATLHHYVAESKRGYFRQTWRQIWPGR